MSLTSNQEGRLRMLLYPVQFEQNPLDGIHRVLDLIRTQENLKGTEADILSAIQAGLSSDAKLADLLPQAHDEETVRAYFDALAGRLHDNQS